MDESFKNRLKKSCEEYIKKKLKEKRTAEKDIGEKDPDRNFKGVDKHEK